MSEDRETYQTTWTIKRLATAAKVSVTTIYNELASGHLKGEKPAGRDWLITDSEAQRWLKDWKQRHP